MIPCTKIAKGISSVHTDRNVGPLVVWNITEKCNLHCSHCYRNSSWDVTGAELTDEECLSVVDDIAALNPPIVLLSGGEPLVRKSVFRIIEKCKSVGLRVGISTNGTLITKEIAEKLKAYDVDYVGISIDGLEERHDAFRGCRGSFLMSFGAISYLNKVGIKTGVRFTLTNDNKDDLFHVVRKTRENGVKRFCLYHLVYSGRGKDVDDVQISEKRDVMGNFFSLVNEFAESEPDFEVLTTDNPADGVFLLNKYEDNPVTSACLNSHGGCSAGDRVLYIDSIGVVNPCQFLRNEILGNVRETALAELWDETKNNDVQIWRAKTEYLRGKCGSCDYKKMCGGCRARAYAVFGSVWEEDPACYLNEDEIKKSSVKSV